MLLLYALAGFFLAPYLVERYVPRYAQEQLGSQATVEDVRINPFLLSLEARDFRLEHPPGQPIVAFGRLFVDFQLSSLFRRAWTFADVQVDGLDLNVEVQRDGSLNLAAFFDRLAKRYADVSSGDQAPRRWLLQHAELREAKLTFSDLSDPTPASTTFAPINLEVLDLTTLPDRHGQYAITAAVRDGGSIAWRGDVSVLPIASAGELEVKGLKLATAWAFMREELGLSQPKGSVDLAARYQLRVRRRQGTLGLESIRAQVSALALSKSGSAEPILALDTIAASEGRFDLAQARARRAQARTAQRASRCSRGSRPDRRLGKVARTHAAPVAAQCCEAGRLGDAPVEVHHPNDRRWRASTWRSWIAATRSRSRTASTSCPPRCTPSRTMASRRCASRPR